MTWMGKRSNNADPIESETTLRASALRVDGQQTHGDSVFPYAIRCESPEATSAEAHAWVSEQRSALLAM